MAYGYFDYRVLSETIHARNVGFSFKKQIEGPDFFRIHGHAIRPDSLDSQSLLSKPNRFVCLAFFVQRPAYVAQKLRPSRMGHSRTHFPRLPPCGVFEVSALNEFEKYRIE